MRLSGLQKYILEKCLESKNNILAKESFYSFYSGEEFKSNKKSVQESVLHCLELMVANGLLIAYGYKTAKKWYIHRVKLTLRGKKLVKEIIRKKQKRLPIK